MNKVRCFAIILFVIVIASTAASEAATYYVNNQATNASDSNPGTSDAPWLTIQHAADSVAAGDTVVVKPGIYYEAVGIQATGTPDAVITFRGEPGAILDGSVSQNIWWVHGFSNWIYDPSTGYYLYAAETDYITIEGFEIRNYTGSGIEVDPAQHDYETGVTIGGDGWTVRNNIIHDTEEGVSLWSGNSWDSGYIITGNYLYNNRWTDIHTHRYSVVERNVALSHASDENIRSCTAYYLPGASHAVNNNTLMNGTFGIQLAYPGSWYKNNIIMKIQPRFDPWDGSRYGGFAFKNSLYEVNYDLTTVNISYNNLFNVADAVGDYTTPQQLPSTVAGMISADPLFVNYTGDQTGDYHLTANSPCIDSGDPADPVPAGGGSRIDIGAYEYPQNDIPSLIVKKHAMYDAGLIDNKGIMTSLDAKLNAAKAALMRGRTKTARNILNALINEAKAQAGKHINAGAAQSLIEDAEMVLRSLDVIGNQRGK